MIGNRGTNVKLPCGSACQPINQPTKTAFLAWPTRGEGKTNTPPNHNIHFYCTVLHAVCGRNILRELWDGVGWVRDGVGWGGGFGCWYLVFGDFPLYYTVVYSTYFARLDCGVFLSSGGLGEWLVFGLLFWDWLVGMYVCIS